MRRALTADAAGAWRSARGAAVVRGAGGASTGFFASGRVTLGFTGVGFWSGTSFAGSGFGGVACFCSGGATTSGFSCGGVGAICSSTACCLAASGGEASAACITGPGARSIGVGCGEDDTGAMSTMITGRDTPGVGRCACQLIASAISAACAATIASADTPQRLISA